MQWDACLPPCRIFMTGRNNYTLHLAGFPAMHVVILLLLVLT